MNCHVLYMYRIAIAWALLMIIKYLYFLHAELFQTDHYIILKQLKATCLSDLKILIIRLRKILCQLNWTMSMASFNIWYPRYFFVQLLPKWTECSRISLFYRPQLGTDWSAIARFKRREFRREIHTPPWLLIGRIIFLTREKTSFAPLIGYNSFAYEHLWHSFQWVYLSS